MLNRWLVNKVRERRAQILLPSVLLAPIFILVIYLLFETAKVSNTKIRHQFALDNAAYSQMTSVSGYLNVIAMINGPFGYRYALEAFPSSTKLRPARDGEGDNVSVFDLFYKGGAFQSIGKNYEEGVNPPPPAESNDWGLRYYQGEELDDAEGQNYGGDRTEWQMENPPPVPDEKHVPVMSQKLTSQVFFPAMAEGDEEYGLAIGYVMEYLKLQGYLGTIYDSQDYTYKETTKHEVMFREPYYYNVPDCKSGEDCARESAAKIRPFLNVNTNRFSLRKLMFYVSESGGGFHVRSYELPVDAVETLKTPLFQFAHLTPTARNNLRTLGRGVLLKQSFKLPRNRFGINLEQKYKPYVRTQVKVSCPRSGNNCVWPNPLPKYSVTLEP